MTGSWTVRVLKRDGSIEAFDSRKLARVLLLASGGDQWDDLRDVLPIADGVQLYMTKRQYRCVSSTAIFEMAMKSVSHLGLHDLRESMEAHRNWRNARRQEIRLVHEDFRSTAWDKSWACHIARTSWHLSAQAARIVAATVEEEMLTNGIMDISRQAAMEAINHRVSEFGLADAVPIGMFEPEGSRQMKG